MNKFRIIPLIVALAAAVVFARIGIRVPGKKPGFFAMKSLLSKVNCKLEP